MTPTHGAKQSPSPSPCLFLVEWAFSTSPSPRDFRDPGLAGGQNGRFDHSPTPILGLANMMHRVIRPVLLQV